MDGFSSIAASLTVLTKKKIKSELTKTCEKSFQDFKNRLTSAPMLTFPKCCEYYTVYCDAYMVCLGCGIM